MFEEIYLFEQFYDQVVKPVAAQTTGWTYSQTHARIYDRINTQVRDQFMEDNDV